MTSPSRILLPSLALLSALGLSAAAEAHTGIGTAVGGGFAAGFTHPFMGLDHLLAMIGVGILAAQKGGRFIWLAPLSFLLMMIVGGAVGMSGLGWTPYETGILGSVVVLGVAIAAKWNPSSLLGGIICGLFALFHGHAHGTEMAVTASPLLYGCGFVLATAMLHAAGIGLTLALRRLRLETAVAPWIGVSMAAIGLALFIGG